jgi:hypothetical protein
MMIERDPRTSEATFSNTYRAPAPLLIQIIDLDQAILRAQTITSIKRLQLTIRS